MTKLRRARRGRLEYGPRVFANVYLSIDACRDATFTGWPRMCHDRRVAHSARKSGIGSPDPSSDKQRVARDRRHSVRRATSLAVRVEVPGREIVGVATDLGLGGMFVKASESLPYAAEVRILFSRSEIGIDLCLPAVVRWVINDGFGLQFGRLGARETRALVLLVTAP